MRLGGLFILIGVMCPVLTPPLARASDDAAAVRGQPVYNRLCAACHGVAGDGKGPAARYLTPRPRDFTVGIYKFHSTPAGMPPTDDDLYRTVTRGVPTTSMPAFEDVLTERERRDVVAYIKRFSASLSEAPAAESIRIPPEPEATAATIAEGKSIYMINACWTCHGARGKAEGEAATVLKDVWGEEVRPVDFSRGRFKGGSDDESLFRTVRTGLTGTPMPSYATSFLYAGDRAKLPSNVGEAYTEEEIAAARAYLASAPSKADIDALSDGDRQALADRRTWALVHYLRSLYEPPSLWHRLFVEDTEVTK